VVVSTEKPTVPSPTRTRSPKIFRALAKTLRGGTKTAEKDSPPPSPSPTVPRPRAKPKVDVMMPSRSGPHRTPPPPDFSEGSVNNPYALGGLGPSASAVSASTSSFTSMTPSDAGYGYEFNRLQINYRASQERLRILQEESDAQQQLYEQERASQQLRHEEELAALRRELSDPKGKRR
jgi:hypothetical protein